jgi:general secretion pathway protein L
MKTSPAEAGAPPTVLAFLDEAGGIGRWLELDDEGVVGRGEASDGFPPAPFRLLLAAPGEQMTLRWLDLADGLAPAQAAAAARLMLADASAEPIGSHHVAVGRPEAGLTPVAMVPMTLVSTWIGTAESAGLDPAAIIPGPLLLAPPEAGFVRLDRGAIADYRAIASAFSLEPDLAAPLVGDAGVETIGQGAFEAGLASIVAAPPLDLRQGGFARRRSWRLESKRMRRVAALILTLAVLTLAVQVATILAFTFAADRAQQEADALGAGARAVGAEGGPGFGATASVLFAAVRDTPNVELARIEYRPDGSLTATVMVDSPAGLAALNQRIEAAGLQAEAGELRTAGGRPTADVTVRPA